VAGGKRPAQRTGVVCRVLARAHGRPRPLRHDRRDRLRRGARTPRRRGRSGGAGRRDPAPEQETTRRARRCARPTTAMGNVGGRWQ
jgi:hypothetical protein